MSESEKKYYILTDSTTREAYGPFSKEEVAKLDLPETTLVCIPSQQSGLKRANAFPELVNLVVSVEKYNLNETDTAKVFYIKHGKQYSELSFDELRNTVFEDTTPIGIGSNKKWYYAGNIEHLKELLNERPPFVPNNDGDAPIIEFEEISDGIVRQIEEEITTCSQLQNSIEILTNNSDEEIRTIYKIYVANFKNMEASMKRIETMAQTLDCHYKTAQDKLASNLPARKRSLQRAYEEKKKDVLSMVSQLVGDFTRIKPFDHCKGFQISPITEWNEISASLRFPQHFLYLGKIHRKYNILGQYFEFSRRDYLELLNFQNLTIHFDNNSIDKSVSLVSTLLCRMLKETRGDILDICVVDPKMGLGLNNDFRTGLPSDKYKVLEKIDPEDIWNHEKRILKMTGGLPVEKYYKSQPTGFNVFHIVVFQDWQTTLGSRIDEDKVIEMINNSASAGYCFIFMVNDDNKPDENSRYRREEDDILSRLPNCAIIDLKNQMDCEGRQFELMNEEMIFEVVKEIRNKVTPQSLKIDIGALLEEKRRWGVQSCNEKITLSVGKINYLKNLELSFADHIIDHYMIVRYREAKSNVIQWINAMIAQAFTLYNPEELNVMLVDFLGNEELARLTGNRTVLEPPFYYLGVNTINQKQTSIKDKISGQIQKITSTISTNPKKRLLAFIIGKDEDIKRYVTYNYCYTKDRIHIVLLSTDFIFNDDRNQSEFEGYQISFGPMRIESRTSQKSQILSGDEFLYEGNKCQAYTFDIEDTCQIIQQYVKIRQNSITSKPTPNNNVNNTNVTLGSDKTQQAREQQTDVIDDNTPNAVVSHNDEIRQGSSSVATNKAEGTYNIEIPTVGNIEEEVKTQEPISEDIQKDNKNTETVAEAKPEETIAIVMSNSVDLQKEQTADEGKENQAVVYDGFATNSVVGSTADSNNGNDLSTRPGFVTETVTETFKNSIFGYADDSDTNHEEEEKFGYQRVFSFKDYMDKILPETEWWKESSSKCIEVPFGIHINRQNDKDEICSLRLSTNEAQENAAFVLGGTGSGKTTFLQSLIVSAAQRYSPLELEFYLIDFKSVGFLPFEKYKLPHVRVVASGADREFGLSVLERIEAEQYQRQNHPGYYPRTVLVIDECQDFFLNDGIADEATRILESLMKKGRQQNINIIVATQELQSDSTTIPSSLYNNIAIRIVAKPNERDYFTLFNRSNQTELEILTNTFKKGELLFVQNKYMASNSSVEDYHVKSLYIQYDEKDLVNSELKEMVERLARYAETHQEYCPKDKSMFFFHNDAPLVEFSNTRMMIEHNSPSEDLPNEIPMYLGVPVAIDNDVYLSLTKDRYQNVLVIGASDAPVGQGITLNALLSSLPSCPEDKRVDYVFDFTKKGEPLHGELTKVVAGPPFNPKSRVIPNKETDVVEKLQEIKGLLEERMTHSQNDVDNLLFVTIFGLDRGSMFGLDHTNTESYIESYLEATNLLNFIICNGPHYGVFTMVQVTGRLELISQLLNIGSNYALFNHVVALLMEESQCMTLMNESGKFLYDKKEAMKNPGLYRALYYNRSNPDVIQKFKPYKF